MEIIKTDYLVLDGDCGLCNRVALFISPRLSKKLSLSFIPIDSDNGHDIVSALPNWQQNLDTVYLLRNGESFVRSAAAIRCLLYLKWYWKILFPLFWIVPLPIRDFIYMLISKYRYRLFKKKEVCMF